MYPSSQPHSDVTVLCLSQLFYQPLPIFVWQHHNLQYTLRKLYFLAESKFICLNCNKTDQEICVPLMKLLPRSYGAAKTFRRANWSFSKVLGMYSRGSGFEFGPRQQLSWLKFLMAFLTPGIAPRIDNKRFRINYFQFINHITIWRYTVTILIASLNKERKCDYFQPK
jgi:hypothetical protein